MTREKLLNDIRAWETRVSPEALDGIIWAMAQDPEIKDEVLAQVEALAQETRESFDPGGEESC